MSCVAVTSGSNFLSATLAHIDCQAELIGSYGYGALADPGSPAVVALAGLLTIFVAILGIRLSLGYPFQVRDAVGTIVRVGIVLTLATSWPAWRIIGYDVVMNGPAEIAQRVAIGAGLPGSSNDLRKRLQDADDGLVAMTAFGTGRLPGDDLRDVFRGVALRDETGFGWGRLFFLFGTVAPYAIVRLVAGVLLSLAPLFGIFFLFSGSSSLFHGWIRGLAFAALGSLTISLVQGVNLALLEPWIAEVISRRTAGEFVPAASTEMAALSLVYVAITAGALFLIARVTFFARLSVRFAASRIAPREAGYGRSSTASEASRALIDLPDRAHAIAAAVGKSLRREELESSTDRGSVPMNPTASGGTGASPMPVHSRPGGETLGSSYRRNFRRSTVSGGQRDRTT
jgi:type IV secretion system protein VirB6